MVGCNDCPSLLGPAPADLLLWGGRPAAVIALCASVAPVVPGFVRAATTPGGAVANPMLFDHLYTHAWFVTFGLSFLIYLVLMQRRD